MILVKTTWKLFQKVLIILTEAKEYLQSELESIEKGKAKFLSVEEAEERFEKIIKKYEDPS